MLAKVNLISFLTPTKRVQIFKTIWYFPKAPQKRSVPLCGPGWKSFMWSPPRLCSYSQSNVSKDIFRATHSLFDILHLIGDESGRRRERGREGHWVVRDYRAGIKTQSNRLPRIDRQPTLGFTAPVEENNNFVLTQRVSMDWEKQFSASFSSN